MSKLVQFNRNDGALSKIEPMNKHIELPQIDCASRLKVLADETRLAVLQQLLDGPKHVSEINASLQLEQSLLSHHLKVLREADLVVAERDGKAVLYSLNPNVEGSRSGKAINLGCCLISFD
jgi:ArsR family transcriptional regulator